MNHQPCNEANAWTCRQPTLWQKPDTTNAVTQPSPCDASARDSHALNSARAFVPGLVEHYLEHQALPVTKDLAVLFVDIADSTRTLLHYPPAHALAVIQRFSELMTDIALAHCGDVKDYEGDGALLYFASIAHATRAALAMRTAFAAEHARDEHSVQARFSLNVGTVMIGVVGSPMRHSIALIGPTVHLAARLLKQVTPGGIIAPWTAIERLQREAPTLAHAFQLRGTCMTIRGFEEQCVTAYHLPGDGAGHRQVASAICDVPSAIPSIPTPQLQTSNVFRSDGEYWTVSFAGTTCHLRDALGLHYIAQLLQHPHHEVHVITLLTTNAELPEEHTKASLVQDAGLFVADLRGGSDAIEILDPQARAAYKQRLQELREELDEAQQRYDFGRSEQLAEEIDVLTRELTSAIGLGGRVRRLSLAERARVNVSRAIKVSLRKISEHHPALGQHLTATIKTGAYCSYTPDPRVPVTWEA